MQSLIFSILLSFFVFISCNKSTPTGILSEKKMISLLEEVHLTDAYLNTLGVDSSKKVINSYYNHIFEKYDLDSIGFAENLNYYLSRPTIAEKLYDKVVVNLKKDQREIVVKDSIQQVKIQDSVMRVQRYLADYQYKKELITRVVIDSSKITFQNIQDRFYNQLPLRLNVYGRDIPLQVTSPIYSPNKPMIDSAGTNLPIEAQRSHIEAQKLFMDEQPLKIDTKIQPIKIDSTIHRLLDQKSLKSRIPLQTKPVYR